ncbi:MAG: SufD family Fe-S cluster assembly protein [Puniceicoccales bacterium]|jgi:Fe-S cluster assembly protein SufD|nr:SufD family Fe-S cluster assembly protein [Puniceicoccales bacterium]
MQWVAEQFESCTFLEEENVIRSVEFEEAGGILFCFCVQSKGFLRVDFRPLENQKIAVQLTLEEGAEAMVRLLCHGRERSDFTFRTLQRHVGNGSKSVVEVRCVCEDEARVDYRGKIEVPEHITGVKAEQKNKNLLLSTEAYVYTEPAMDIRSKDVECFHGAAVGGIDPEVLRYFSMRGMEKLSAQELYIAGFLN